MAARVVIFGLGNVLLGLLGALICVGVLLSSLGLGVLVAASSLRHIGAGFMLGAFGSIVSLGLLALCLLQAYIGAAVLRGRSLGLVGGVLIAALYVLTSWGTSLGFLAFGLFGLWALFTRRSQFA